MGSDDEEDYEEEYEDDDSDDSDEEARRAEHELDQSQSEGGKFSVVASWRGSAMDTVLLHEGCAIWQSRGDLEDHVDVPDDHWNKHVAKLAEIPGQLAGGRLIQSQLGTLGEPGSQFTVRSQTCDARIFVVVEVPPHAPSPPGANAKGSLASALAHAPRWLPEEECPSWKLTPDPDEAGSRARLKKPDLLMFSTFLPKGKALVLPEAEVTSSENFAAAFAVVVPLQTGTFLVSVSSTSASSYERTTLMQDGAVPWTDRDHRFMDVPEYLIGGVLIQGPYREPQAGTVLTVRANACASIYVLVERRSGKTSSSLSLYDNLIAAGWFEVKGAPRWHDMHTMQTLCCRRPAGWATVLPPLGMPGGECPVFSIIAVPEAGEPTAPLEMTVSHQQHGEDAELAATLLGACAASADLDMSPMTEGATVRSSGSSGMLSNIPPWMLGATLGRTGQSVEQTDMARMLPRFGVRAAAPSVLYALVPAEQAVEGGAAGVLAAAGWERRQEAPELLPAPGSGHRRVPLSVFAKRALAREMLAVPPFPEEDAPKTYGTLEVLAVVVKVDTEAFDVCAQTSDGLDFSRSLVKETGVVWTDRQNRLAWIPDYMTGGMLLRGPHEIMVSPGTMMRIRASGTCRACVAVEAQYNAPKAVARNGRGLPDLLLQAGWEQETLNPPGWGDVNSTLKVFSRRIPDGQMLEFPLHPTEPAGAQEAPLLMMVAVVSIMEGSERIGDELRRSFKVWDQQKLRGLRQEDLRALLTTLCPKLGPAQVNAVLEQAAQAPLDVKNKSGGGVVSYEDFLEKLLLFGPVGEKQAEASPTSAQP
eukprot:TRINITY_DN27380_c0_g1_i1.p1 TRINITY_DN27380_c0_g1~~TRINITY_DN27380_c0_g1_i1.p1  ORF type:complete len:814 (+),score=165.63 TRINITY_DN27380_c0_g1_i1:72-2513(+)